MLKPVVISIVAVFALYNAACVNAQVPTVTVWDGVYTAEQAARGKVEYANHCERCHGPDLTSGRPIVGKQFLERWREDRLDALFNYVRTAMPRLLGGSLPDNVYVEIFTYLLQRNGFPEGQKALTVDAPAAIELVGKNGPQPVPDGALIVTVGCMTHDSDNRWLLTNATEPKRTRKPYQTTQDELAAAQATPAGPHTFLLAEFEAINSSRPENFEGLRMQAKGFLVRQPGAERISLFHLGMISGKCP
jgi:S-disulfanyl-L-cysteine oxidoreductase SoxD